MFKTLTADILSELYANIDKLKATAPLLKNKQKAMDALNEGCVIGQSGNIYLLYYLNEEKHLVFANFAQSELDGIYNHKSGIILDDARSYYLYYKPNKVEW